MTFSLVYELDFKRIISAVINDSRNTISATANQPGMVVYAYIQGQIALVVPGVLVYRLTTDQGNLGGYVAIQGQNGVASVILMQLRPAFIPFSQKISLVIANFISGNEFLQDMIY